MSLESRLVSLVQAIGADIKSLFARSVPTGGSVGQVLTKTGSGDNVVDWQTPTEGGGSPSNPLIGWFI